MLPESRNEDLVEKWTNYPGEVRPVPHDDTGRCARRPRKYLESATDRAIRPRPSLGWGYAPGARKSGNLVKKSRFHPHRHFLSSTRRHHHHLRKFHHPIHKNSVLKPLERLNRIKKRLYKSRKSFYPQNFVWIVRVVDYCLDDG
ncbi:hypothetical protein E3N88_26556 [Mikania micrantha]|uniref:Uncharacterized protein n=1 Tax=Mikania micrantha TaxID=192012 RepID=A0A5N6MWU4_9ASTR|nr:hypothetical protein E3N88_26556 [Mikania micrantha]